MVLVLGLVGCAIEPVFGLKVILEVVILKIDHACGRFFRHFFGDPAAARLEGFFDDIEVGLLFRDLLLNFVQIGTVTTLTDSFMEIIDALLDALYLLTDFVDF